MALAAPRPSCWPGADASWPWWTSTRRALKETAAALTERGATASVHVADVADPERVRTLPDEVVAEHGGVHIVVNNAGVSVLKTFADHSLEDLQWLLGINLMGVVHGCHFFLPRLLEADEAHIVNISSMFGFVGVPGQSSYCASKFAVRGLTESLWAELRDTSVGVTSIHPGGIATNIFETIRVNEESQRAQMQETFEKHGHPPEEVAQAILRGIEEDRLRVIVGREAFVFEWLKRLLPVTSNKILSRRINLAR